MEKLTLYKTRISNQHASSEKLGDCGICNKYATEVYILSVWEEYKKDEFSLLTQRFGHKDCLEEMSKKYSGSRKA